MKPFTSSRLRRAAWVFVFLAAVGAAAADRELRGFPDVPFGTTRSQVIDELCAQLKIEKVQGFSGVDYRGPNGLRIDEDEDSVVLHGYRFEGVRVDAAFYFNLNDRFFRIEYDAQKRPSGYFETTIKDDAVALSKAFQKHFGSPSFQMEPRLSEMRPGSRNYFWRWTKGRDTVYTAIVGGEDDFGAEGVISDDALMREARVPRPDDNAVTVSSETIAVPGSESFSVSGASAPAAAETPAPPVGPQPAENAVPPAAVSVSSQPAAPTENPFVPAPAPDAASTPTPNAP